MSAARSPRRYTPSRGAVLLLVLGAIALLTILAVTLAHRTGLEASEASRYGREAAFRRAFGSGLEIAKGLLAEGRANPAYDYWGDGWRREVKVELARGESLSVQVADESGKFDLATVTDGTRQDAVEIRRRLARLFDYLARNDADREEEWKKAQAAVFKRLGLGEVGEAAGRAGTTASAKAVPLLTLDGLREEGLDLAIVFGTGKKGEFGAPGALCDVVTVFGDGKVNLNTAPAAVLYALDEEYSDALVSSIVAWRGKDDGLTDVRPFRTVQDLEMVEGVVQYERTEHGPKVVKNLLKKVQGSVTVQSRAFSVRMRARIEGREREAWGFFAMEEATAGAGANRGALKLVAYEEIEP